MTREVEGVVLRLPERSLLVTPIGRRRRDESVRGRTGSEDRWRRSFGMVTHLPSDEWSDWDGEDDADPALPALAGGLGLEEGRAC